MERVHPQARFDHSGREAHVVHAAPMCGSPRPTSGHSRGPALVARGPAPATGFLDQLHSAFTTSGSSTVLHRSTSLLPPPVSRLPWMSHDARLLRTFLASLRRIDWPPSPGTRPVARRRLPLPNRPAAFCCRVQPPGMLSPPGLPIDRRSGRSCRVATTPHLSSKDPQRRCRPPARCCTSSSLGHGARSSERPPSPSSQRAMLSSAADTSTGRESPSTIRIPVRLPWQLPGKPRHYVPDKNCHCGLAAGSSDSSHLHPPSVCTVHIRRPRPPPRSARLSFLPHARRSPRSGSPPGADRHRGPAGRGTPRLPRRPRMRRRHPSPSRTTDRSAARRTAPRAAAHAAMQAPGSANAHHTPAPTRPPASTAASAAPRRALAPARGPAAACGTPPHLGGRVPQAAPARSNPSPARARAHPGRASPPPRRSTSDDATHGAYELRSSPSGPHALPTPRGRAHMHCAYGTRRQRPRFRTQSAQAKTHRA